MLQLVDGPCQGGFLVKRAPVYLRAVKRGDGELDVLDQVNDTPAADEKVFVYKIEGEAGVVHINSTKVKGFFAMASYRHMPEVDGEALRDNTAWQVWATERMKKS